ncbi:MAG: hypothetical protein J3K34DRAFT_481362 [Monoraphidium minutum]|nr:MAG: hypothetical protein J3K34DRAFT_481362 [Monoraphidium minutum]
MAADSAAEADQAEVPAWLKPERFEDPKFNPEAVVADLRRHVPLNIAKSELQAYLVRLKEQMIEVINQDFGDYVGLASRLSCVDGSVVRMKQPLLDIKAKLGSVQEALRSELAALQAGLGRRQEIAAARGTLELMQEVAHVASKVEKLLSEVAAASAAAAGGGRAGGAAAPPAAPSPSASMDAAVAEAAGGDADAHARLLERVAAEVSRLTFLANKGKELAFVASLERRIQVARLQLGSHLSAALAAALAQRKWGAAAHCLRAYVELGDAPAGEATLRVALAAPLAAGAVRDAKERIAADPSAKSQEVALVSRAALSDLEQRAGPLLPTLLAPSSGLAAFDVLGAVLLQEITSAIADGLPGAFSPGNPAAFHSNFLAGQALLASLEGLARTRAAVERLRASDAYAAFGKRWNLSVYFSLQYQEIAGALEDAARGDKLEAAPANGGGGGGGPAPQLAATAALWGCLRRCASERVFLPPLADRFLRLGCQLAARYASWAAAAAAARRAAAANPGAAAAAAAAAAAPPVSPGAPGGAAPAAGAPQRHGPEAWAGAVAAEELLAICCDAAATEQLLTGQLPDDFLRLLPGADGGAAGAVRGAMEAAARRIKSASDEVLGVVAEEVAERCSAVVRQLKGITATYRMTSKGPPTRHSHYVSGVLAPLRQALDAPGAPARLPPPLRLALAAAVFDSVNGRYAQLAEELLASVRKTESSLKRLKKGRGPDGGAPPGEPGAAEMSDSEKICLQLFLDAQEHGRQAERFGLAPAESASFAALLAAVAPGGGGGGGGPTSPQHAGASPGGGGFGSGGGADGYPASPVLGAGGSGFPGSGGGGGPAAAPRPLFAAGPPLPAPPPPFQQQQQQPAAPGAPPLQQPPPPGSYGDPGRPAI